MSNHAVDYEVPRPSSTKSPFPGSCESGALHACYSGSIETAKRGGDRLPQSTIRARWRIGGDPSVTQRNRCHVVFTLPNEPGHGHRGHDLWTTFTDASQASVKDFGLGAMPIA